VLEIHHPKSCLFIRRWSCRFIVSKSWYPTSFSTQTQSVSILHTCSHCTDLELFGRLGAASPGLLPPPTTSSVPFQTPSCGAVLIPVFKPRVATYPMLDNATPPSRNAVLRQSPRKCERKPESTASTPAATPHSSPERKRRHGATRNGEISWSRAKAAPAAIKVTGSPYQYNRGQQFTVGNVSNGLIYLRYGLFDMKKALLIVGPMTKAICREVFLMM
jgi:hypothetical protein